MNGTITEACFTSTPNIGFDAPVYAGCVWKLLSLDKNSAEASEARLYFVRLTLHHLTSGVSEFQNPNKRCVVPGSRHVA